MNLFRQNLSQHLKAGAIHLTVSAFVASMAMAVIYVLWYPAELAELQGVSRLVLILIGVDVVLGPLLTTIIYSPGKKGLLFDLVVIAVLQISALLYGLHAINGGRPAYIVFNIDRFDVVAVEEVDKGSLSRVSENFEISWFGPKWVGAQLPSDSKEREALMFSAVSGGPDVPQMPELFVEIKTMAETMAEHYRPISELKSLNELSDREWAAFLKKFGDDETRIAYLPLRANATDGAVIYDAKSLDLLGVSLMKPKFASKKKKQPT